MKWNQKFVFALFSITTIVAIAACGSDRQAPKPATGTQKIVNPRVTTLPPVLPTAVPTKVNTAVPTKVNVKPVPLAPVTQTTSTPKAQLDAATLAAAETEIALRKEATDRVSEAGIAKAEGEGRPFDEMSAEHQALINFMVEIIKRERAAGLTPDPARGAPPAPRRDANTPDPALGAPPAAPRGV